MAQSFEITGQREVIDLTADQGAVKSVEVSFTTVPNGIRGTVTIPKATYSPQAVQQAVQPYAEALEASHVL